MEAVNQLKRWSGVDLREIREGTDEENSKIILIYLRPKEISLYIDCHVLCVMKKDDDEDWVKDTPALQATIPLQHSVRQ
jgi:hypothetical protein